ncbi:methyltransferase domain-containing protein [Aquimarina sp. 2201CG1-2-11]|uniref:methyltransferase domain-containing protein n=1 Tax=Aquimarina discodermiae TaxID=3231043 RepID=UPI0034621822
MINTKQRSDCSEIMDDFALTGEVLKNTLDQIATINKLLGGNNITLNGIKKILPKQPEKKTVVIVDLGCGNGDMLRAVARLCKKRKQPCKLIGIDANEYTLKYARDLSKEYPEISYINQDILSDNFDGLSCDIILSTLFFHHFTTTEIENVITVLLKKVQLGIVINDLHRHPVAYYLFKLICIFIKNPMVKNDGLVSILRGFKKKELQQIATQFEERSNIKWKWAFRYQWIIKK